MGVGNAPQFLILRGDSIWIVDAHRDFSNSAGSDNTAVGIGALASNTADANTAIGASALATNTTGGTPGGSGASEVRPNTAVGANALVANTTGGANTAVGFNALSANPDATFNTAVGFKAMENSVGSIWGSAFGYKALDSNTQGQNDTAIGALALFNNTTGLNNTAVGFQALPGNTTGGDNTAVGKNALSANTTASGNTAIGSLAGYNQTTGNFNVYIGQGMEGVAGEATHTYIRNINITDLSGGGTDTATVDLATGLLGHLTSSRRYKEDIRPMNNASEALYQLKPVSFRYKKASDRTQSPAFGLIAEEVAEVNPSLVAYNVKGQPESIHYEMVNAMLLNEFLKEHRKTEKLEATVVRQQKQIEALTADLQRVGAQLELNKLAPQTVKNNEKVPDS